METASVASMAAAEDSVPDRQDQRFLLVSILIIAGCSLVYELLISSLSSYLLGSSVVHFSVTIGLFLFFMGIGSWLAKFVRHYLLDAFIFIEITLGVVGGFCSLLLYVAYTWTEFYYLVMFLVIAAISVLIGMEIPILTRVIERGRGLRHSVSDVLATDYVGALLASLLFPFVLLPYLGHLLTAFAIGALNLLVALMVLWRFRRRLIAGRAITVCSIVAVMLLAVGSFQANTFHSLADRALYEDPVIFSSQTRYQKIVVTERGDDVRLFLNGSLQFSSLDEYRYHEPLVHLPATHSIALERALVIGGGDGMAVRELLNYPSLSEIVLVDIDPEVTQIASTHTRLSALNAGALDDARVRVVNRDAWNWLGEQGDLFDVIVIDLPDPDTAEIARLYSAEFYQKVARRLSVGGVVITQASSPWLARRTFWTVIHTLESVFDFARPVYSQVPSFGPWGFVMASDTPLEKRRPIPASARYLSDHDWQFLLSPPPDLPPIDADINRIGSLSILRDYQADYGGLQNGSSFGE